MSVEKFLDKLKFLLSDLPEEEREEAIDFYRCYFEDAGEENEEAVIEELGSPERVAYMIREGLKEKEDEGEYTETGYRTYEDISAPATRNAHKEEKEPSASENDSYNHISVEELYKQRYAKPGKKEAKQAKKEEKQAKREEEKSRRKDGNTHSANQKTVQSGTAKQQDQPKQSEKRRDDNQLGIIGDILMGIVKVLMVIAAVCIVVLLICAVVVLVALVVAAVAATIGFLVVGIGLLVTGAGLVGVAMIGLAFLSFAVFLLLLIALVAFCKNGLAGGIRGITSVTGDVVHGKKRREA